MDRRKFLTGIGAVGAAQALTISEQAEALEARMIRELERGRRALEAPQALGRDPKELAAERAAGNGKITDGRRPQPPEDAQETDPRRFLQGAALRPIANHYLRMPAVALKAGVDERSCSLCPSSDIGVFALARSDHGYWGAQLVEPYVSERVSWAIRYHQALRFFPDPSVGYDYPDSYIRALWQRLRARALRKKGRRVREEPQVVHGSAPGHHQRPLRFRPERSPDARALHRHHRPPSSSPKKA